MQCTGSEQDPEFKYVLSVVQVCKGEYGGRQNKWGQRSKENQGAVKEYEDSGKPGP